jgi:hypothetical protein
MSASEAEAVNNFADAGQDKLPGIVAELVSSVVGIVAQKNRPLGPDGTIPDDLRHDVIHLAVEHYLLKIPAALVTEARKSAAEEARKKLIRVEKGEYRPIRPDGTFPGGPASETQSDRHLDDSTFDRAATN